MTQLANVPDFKVTLNGTDLTGAIRPRLVSLTVTDKRDDADQLEIVIDDTDGRVALPKTGDQLNVMIGWKSGPDVTVGLVNKGNFLVDEVSHDGPPDTIHITARSADFTDKSDFRTRRETSWVNTSVGAVLHDLAARNGWELKVAPDVASIQLASVHQSRESDAALLRRLGREHDCVATIKAGKLLFQRVGSGKTASGKALPTYVFQRRDGDRHSYQLSKREEVTGVSASYHDRGAGKHVRIVSGTKQGAKHLSRVYANAAAARRATDAALSRSKRQPAKMQITAAYGVPELGSERPVQVQGFKAEIDATPWLLEEVSHRIEGAGFLSELHLEPAL